MRNVRRIACPSTVSDRVAKSDVYWAAGNTEPTKDSPVALSYPDGDDKIRHFEVALNPKHFGEAYHVLICGILLKRSGHEMKIHLNWSLEADMNEIKELLKWYAIDFTPPIPNSQKVLAGKDSATEAIHAAFNACRTTYQHTKQRPRIDHQDALFATIRYRLELDWSKYLHGMKPTDVYVDKFYHRPSYAAKYWLNRYFRLTGQPLPRRTISWRKRGPRISRRSRKRLAPLVYANWSKLPREENVKRLAVVHVRRTASTDVGRSMDAINLEHVAQSIVYANHAATAREQAIFSHIMLYGDFYTSEAHDLKKLVEKHTTTEVRFAQKLGYSHIRAGAKASLVNTGLRIICIQDVGA